MTGAASSAGGQGLLQPGGRADKSRQGQGAAVRGPGDVGDDKGRVGQRDGGVLGPQPGAGGLGEDEALSAVAVRLGSTPMSVALAWLLRRSPNILLITGTSSVAHLRENAAGAYLSLSDEDLAELDKIGR